MNDRLSLSILKPEALSSEVHYIVTQAMQKGYAGVIVAPVWLARAATMIRGTDVRTGVVVSFPHGGSKATLKAIEATSSIKEGAEDVYVSANLTHLIARDYDATRAELMEVVRASRATRRDVAIHVIVESALLLALGPGRGEESIATACRAVRESGCDGIATASGFHRAGGATTDALTQLKQHAEGLIVTAMGGIANLSVAEALLESGADRAVIDPSI